MSRNFSDFFMGVGGGGGIVTPLRPIDIPWWTGDRLNGERLPVIRSGQNRHFQFSSVSPHPIALINTATAATIASIAATAVVPDPGATFCAGAYYDSADQCLYVLAKNTANLFRLAKIDDTTGAVTPLGAGFTPANPANFATTTLGTVFMRNGSVLQVRGGANTGSNDINITTGALISEGDTISIGGYARTAGCSYVSADGKMGWGATSAISAVNTSAIQFGGVSGGNYLQSSVFLPLRDVFGIAHTTNANATCAGLVMVDSDKIYLAAYTPNTAPANTANILLGRLFMRSELDRLLRQIMKFNRVTLP